MLGEDEREGRDDGDGDGGEMKRGGRERGKAQA